MTETTAQEAARRRHDLSEAATKKVFKRLIPFLLLMYVIAFLDRANVSFAQQEFEVDFGGVREPSRRPALPARYHGGRLVRTGCRGDHPRDRRPHPQAPTDRRCPARADRRRTR